MKTVKKVLLLLLVVLVIAIAGFVMWASSAHDPEVEALAALETDNVVHVSDDQWLTFEPSIETDTGFIFYPGGRVDYRSYAPVIRKVASEGYFVVVVPMPLNLAVFSPGRAAEVIEAYPEIEHWIIGGHSLGGAMAANYVYNNPSAVEGLVLWASYPAENNALTEVDIAVASIYGSLDGQVEKIRASYVLLPEHTQWVEIDGANHAQFGWYGPQHGDNPATISHTEQEDEILRATLEFFNSVED